MCAFGCKASEPKRPIPGVFTGKCIHGNPGASIKSGCQVNPRCEVCVRDGKV